MNTDPQAPRGAASAVERRPGDDVATSWVDGAPRFVRPYLRLMRLDRPIGAWLLFWPCVFGLALGATATGQPYPPPLYVVLCGVGAVVMRGAGCTYNDIIDRDFDAQVERTRGRPIPSGAVSVVVTVDRRTILNESRCASATPSPFGETTDSSGGGAYTP